MNQRKQYWTLVQTLGGNLNEEKLKAKVKHHLEESGASLRSLATESQISATTLSLWLAGKRMLSRAATRRLTRSIDPFKADLDARAHVFALKLKREYFSSAEIAHIGRRLFEMHTGLEPNDGNKRKQNETL
jgi:transcriptional regulator with XRE-family HTH domain